MKKNQTIKCLFITISCLLKEVENSSGDLNDSRPQTWKLDRIPASVLARNSSYQPFQRKIDLQS